MNFLSTLKTLITSPRKRAMHTSIERLTSDVLQYTSHTSPRRNMDEDEKVAAAKSLGLNLLSVEGSNSMVVGEHPEMPGLVVKVVPKDDRYAAFAQWMLQQKKQPTCFPSITAVVELPHAFMIVVEKIKHSVDYDDGECEYLDNRLTYGWDSEEKYSYLEHAVNECRRLRNEVGGSFDAHVGNFMRREDGTLVFIDPLWC